MSRKFHRPMLPYCLVINGRTLACFADERVANAEAKFFRRQHKRLGFQAKVVVVHKSRKHKKSATARPRRRLYG